MKFLITCSYMCTPVSSAYLSMCYFPKFLHQLFLSLSLSLSSPPVCLVEALRKVDPVLGEETLLFGLGTLRNLSIRPELSQQLATVAEVMPLLLNTLGFCNQSGRNPDILIQVKRERVCVCVCVQLFAVD